MRLAFLCSGLEPGRDGIGDYARSLAAACTAAGHETRLAAVRDPLLAVDGQMTTMIPHSNAVRFQDVFENATEARALRAWLEEFRPDWVSVQFTPFGFHPQGLGRGRAAFLHELLPASSQRHLMAHEIWLQPGRDGTIRHQLLGWFQRGSVDAWVGPGWRPAVVHTQARLHRERLRARGVNAEILPLFSTFATPALTLKAARNSVADWAGKHGRPTPPMDAASIWIGHFGAFHDTGWDWVEFAARVAQTMNEQNKRACFLALGRAAAAQRAWTDAARRVPTADFIVLGEMPAEFVPVAMQACDAAFTSTPWDIVEKSSAVAAWRALDIPVLVTRSGAVAAAQLPPWPDSGLMLADSVIAKIPGRFERVPGPDFLKPENAARTLLSALATAASKPA